MSQRQNKRQQYEFDYIVGILDAQGFTSRENNFIVRELSLASNRITHTIHFSTDIPETLNSGEYLEDGKLVKWRQTQQFQKWKIHGLSFDKLDGMPQVALIPFIKLMFDLMKECNGSKLGVKNSQLANLLNKYKIPCYDISQFLAELEEAGTQTNQNAFIQSVKPCSGHEIYFSGMRCSEQKAYGTWKWLQTYLASLKYKRR